MLSSLGRGKFFKLTPAVLSIFSNTFSSISKTIGVLVLSPSLFALVLFGASVTSSGSQLIFPTEALAAVPKKKASAKVVLRKTPIKIKSNTVFPAKETGFVKRKSVTRPATVRAAKRKSVKSKSPVVKAGSRRPRVENQEQEVVLPPQTIPARVVSTLPVAPLELAFHPAGVPVVGSLESLSLLDENRSYLYDQAGNKISLTLLPDLQLKAKSLLQRYQVPWGAIVAIEPKTGRVLSLAGYSAKEPDGSDLPTRATFPAASLFKLITAAAAIERAGLTGSDLIAFHGGNYTLERSNYLPNVSKDRRKISFADALGKSVNPAFARVGLNFLNGAMLERYATSFGFNAAIPFDGPLDMSTFQRPADEYETARTAAGFGPVFISPLHAALITATIANRGLMMRPYIVDQVVAADGSIRYQSHNTPIRTSIMSSTSRELLSMMQATVENGTARRQFVKVRNSFLRNTNIAAKTGTLNGTNPKGTYHWFVAAVPAENPEIAIATLIIDPGTARVKSSALAREILEHFFRNRSGVIETRSSNPRKLQS